MDRVFFLMGISLCDLVKIENVFCIAIKASQVNNWT